MPGGSTAIAELNFLTGIGRHLEREIAEVPGGGGYRPAGDSLGRFQRLRFGEFHGGQRPGKRPEKQASVSCRVGTSGVKQKPLRALPDDVRQMTVVIAESTDVIGNEPFWWGGNPHGW